MQTLEDMKNVIGAKMVQAIREEASKWVSEGKDLKDFLGLEHSTSIIPNTLGVIEEVDKIFKNKKKGGMS